MPRAVFILPDGSKKDVNADNGISLMEVAHNNDIFQIEGACGGSLSCATCHVILEKVWYEKAMKFSDKTEDEEDMLDIAFNVTMTSRLSCQIIMRDELDGIIVKIPKEV